jgi:hypothetical protein
MWPATASEVRRSTAQLAAATPRLPQAAGPRDARIPERTPAVRGPLEVYYYDHLAVVLGDAAGPLPKIAQRSGVLAYEALNLVDGKRTVSDIRDLLAGRYEPVPLAEVVEWLDLLGRAGVVRFRER